MLTCLWLAAAPVGAEAAVSAGLEVGWGEAITRVPLSTYADGVVSMGAEAGLRLASRWVVGAWGRAGVTVRVPREDAGLALRYHLRAGVWGEWRFRVDEALQPFVGAAFGYEWVTASPLQGFEGTVRVGGDVRLNETFFLGVALVGSVGMFSYGPERRSTSTRPDAIAYTAVGGVHGWAGLLFRCRASL